MKQIKFDKDYSKLDDKFFTTIRNHDKHIFNNEIVCIKSPDKKFKAICESWSKVMFKDISLLVLGKDLDIDCFIREDALNHMKVFYPDLAMDSFVWVYAFAKV